MWKIEGKLHTYTHDDFPYMCITENKKKKGLCAAKGKLYIKIQQPTEGETAELLSSVALIYIAKTHVTLQFNICVYSHYLFLGIFFLKDFFLLKNSLKRL